MYFVFRETGIFGRIVSEGRRDVQGLPRGKQTARPEPEATQAICDMQGVMLQIRLYEPIPTAHTGHSHLCEHHWAKMKLIRYLLRLITCRKDYSSSIPCSKQAYRHPDGSFPLDPGSWLLPLTFSRATLVVLPLFTSDLMLKKYGATWCSSDTPAILPPQAWKAPLPSWSPGTFQNPAQGLSALESLLRATAHALHSSPAPPPSATVNHVHLGATSPLRAALQLCILLCLHQPDCKVHRYWSWSVSL